jgi:hypothetical protein
MKLFQFALDKSERLVRHADVMAVSTEPDHNPMEARLKGGMHREPGNVNAVPALRRAIEQQAAQSAAPDPAGQDDHQRQAHPGSPLEGHVPPTTSIT